MFKTGFIRSGDLKLNQLPLTMEWRLVLRSQLVIYFGHILAYCSLTDIKGCGSRYRTDSQIPTISHGYNSRPSDFPWHVAIYRIFNSPDTPEYICGGSVIHHKLILTAAHCVYDEDTLSISNATFTVITGKFIRSWDYQDSFEQRFKVIDIKIPRGYKGLIQRYANDIAVLSLNETIKFSSVVIPICISWDSEIEMQELSDVTVVGWGLTENGTCSNDLLTTQLKYLNFTTCTNRFMHEGFSQYVTDDKFCAGLENGTSVEQGDSGGGLIISKNSTNNEPQYYIVGIVSTKDVRTNIATFTNINKLLPWLNKTVLAFIEEGYCPPLTSKSVELTLCNYNGTSVDCKKPAVPGTKAKLQCKNSFHAESPYPLYMDTECHENLTWSPLMDSCLECGRRYKFNNYKPLITYKQRKVSEFPWHVGIYRKYKTGLIDCVCGGTIIHPKVVLTECGRRYKFNNYKPLITYKQRKVSEFPWHVGIYRKYKTGLIDCVCGGTIIHPKVVLTAANCIYLRSEDRMTGMKGWFVVAGKYEREWNITANFEQRFEVSRAIVHHHYITNRTIYEGNIAMLMLNDTLKISSYIMPVCIDWSNKLKLLEKSYVSGLISGWGLTEEGDPSDVLRSTQMLMINHTSCILRPLWISLSPDKWCIVSEDGSWVSFGDAGEIVFPKYEEETGKLSYYLHGILSNSVSKDVNSATDVLYYENWIKINFVYIFNNGKRTN